MKATSSRGTNSLCQLNLLSTQYTYLIEITLLIELTVWFITCIEPVIIDTPKSCKMLLVTRHRPTSHTESLYRTPTINVQCCSMPINSDEIWIIDPDANPQRSMPVTNLFN